jgi:hypothetical protein
MLSGHDHAPPMVSFDPLALAEQIRYSLFMHHSCGLALLGIGVLALADRATDRRYRAIRKGIGAIWLGLGIHIVMNADPTHWPMAAGFMDSFSRPAADEWVQHKLLSLIPLGLGLFLMVVPYRTPKPFQNFLLAGVMGLGGLGLLIHMHEHQPGIELIERQHQVMALLSFVSATGAQLEGLERVTWKLKAYVLPICLILLGFVLIMYTE